MRRTELTVAQILGWADAYHERTGQWPGVKSGRVWEPANETWQNIDASLRLGQRGLHRGQSLAKLLAKHRGKRNRKALPKFTIAQILKWADDHHKRTGRWPHSDSGSIAGTRGETWWAVDMALRHGQRGMAGGSSIAQLLATKRGVANRLARPRLSVRCILHWADAQRRRTGNWPTEESGPIPLSQGDTWMAVAKALRSGSRGLHRSSLATLLARHRGVTRHRRDRPLTIKQILAWADEHYSRTRYWPKRRSGPVHAVPGESWQRIDKSLGNGRRGLPGGQTLAKLLAEHRGIRSRVSLPLLTERMILRWARAYRQTNGRWPHRDAGLIPGTGGETWGGVNMALKRAGRRLPRRTTLSKLLAAHG